MTSSIKILCPNSSNWVLTNWLIVLRYNFFGIHFNIAFRFTYVSQVGLNLQVLQLKFLYIFVVSPIDATRYVHLICFNFHHPNNNLWGASQADFSNHLLLLSPNNLLSIHFSNWGSCVFSVHWETKFHTLTKQMVLILICMRELSGSNLYSDVERPEWRFMWISSLCPRKFWDNTWLRSRHFPSPLSYWSFTNYRSLECYNLR
jgi:hypothetical protein